MAKPGGGRGRALRPPADLLDVLDVSLAIPAPVAAVWEALVDERRRAAWWSYLELDARSGGALVERWHDAFRPRTTVGEVLEVEEPRRLRWRWRDDDWPADTEVEVSLEDDRRGDARTLRRVGVGRARAAGHADPDRASRRWRRLLGSLRDGIAGPARA